MSDEKPSLPENPDKTLSGFSESEKNEVQTQQSDAVKMVNDPPEWQRFQPNYVDPNQVKRPGNEHISEHENEAPNRNASVKPSNGFSNKKEVNTFENISRGENRDKTLKIIKILGVVALLAFIAVVLFMYISRPKASQEIPEEYETVVEENPVKSELIDKYGKVELTGMFGAVPSTLTFDFDSDLGKRYYNSRPNDAYGLRLSAADYDAEGNYYLEIVDLLENRIEIGVFSGVFNGTTFEGTYKSKQGENRTFSFSKK